MLNDYILLLPADSSFLCVSAHALTLHAHQHPHWTAGLFFQFFFFNFFLFDFFFHPPVKATNWFLPRLALYTTLNSFWFIFIMSLHLSRDLVSCLYHRFINSNQFVSSLLRLPFYAPWKSSAKKLKKYKKKLRTTTISPTTTHCCQYKKPAGSTTTQSSSVSLHWLLELIPLQKTRLCWPPHLSLPPTSTE